jgi:uncharacterized Zn finger protein
MQKELKCPRCQKTQMAEVFKRGGKVVAVLFTECGHDIELKK